MQNGKTWLLIADASKARIFSVYKASLFQNDDPKHLELIGNFTHDDSRKKNGDLVSDKIEGGMTPKAIEAEHFALELLHKLNSGLIDKSYRDIVLIAPPTFMGLLQKHMPQEVHKLVAQKIEKDYTQCNGQELMKNLLAHF